MFPFHTCVSNQPTHSISATTPLPTVSTEFSPPFNLCDTVVPPDEFPDLVHSDPPLSSVPDPIPNTSLPLRHSSRVHKPPAYLRDYHYNLISTSVLASASLISFNDSIASSSVILYPLSFTLSYDKFSPPHKAFSIALTIHKEPKSYVQALLDAKWQDAMQAEIEALQANKTWVITTFLLVRYQLVVSGCSKLN